MPSGKLLQAQVLKGNIKAIDQVKNSKWSQKVYYFSYQWELFNEASLGVKTILLLVGLGCLVEEKQTMLARLREKL